MAKHTTQITISVAGVESEHTLTVDYDYAQAVREGKVINQEYVYLAELISDEQYDAIKEEIKRSHAEI